MGGLRVRINSASAGGGVDEGEICIILGRLGSID